MCSDALCSNRAATQRSFGNANLPSDSAICGTLSPAHCSVSHVPEQRTRSVQSILDAMYHNLRSRNAIDLMQYFSEPSCFGVLRCDSRGTILLGAWVKIG
jgi:hypothetical protein